MGCGSSSASDNPDEIKTEMKKTLIPSYDDLFSKISEVLEKCEKIRGGLQDNTDDMLELSNAELLKKPELVDAINAWLWSVSASCEGHIAKANLKIEENSPYISWELGNSYVDCWSFQQKLKDFITTCLEAGKDLIELSKTLEELAGQAKDFGATAKDDAKAANLGLGDTVKAVSGTVANCKTTVDGVGKVKKVKEAVEAAAKNLREILPKFPQMISEADKVGEKAHKEGNLVPSACMKYSDKEKKPAAEHEKCKKEIEKKKKAKKDKKEKKEKGGG